MIIKLREVVASVEAFNELSSKEINARTAFKIARLMNRLEIEYKLFCEARNKIIQKYAEKDENDNIIVNENGDFTVISDNVNLFNKEFEDLLNTTIEVELSQINIEEIENISITPILIAKIEPFISE